MTIGERLKEERQRIGLNQTDWATECGVSKNTQLAYEKGERTPDAAYLEKALILGVDVMYVVAGQRKTPPANTLSPGAAELFRFYDQISESDQAVLLRMAQAFAKARSAQ